MLKWIGGLAALAFIVGGAAFFYFIPAKVDADLNAVLPHDPYPVSPEAAALHVTLRLADLHADTLLWMRDPLKRHTRGQTDVPRLREGGFRLQVFTAVTKAPKAMNYDQNTDDTDNITPLVIAQRWPVSTWSSLAARAEYQALRLHRAAARSGGALAVVTTRAELEASLAAGALAGILGMEGAHPLEGDLGNLARLYDAGHRVIGLQHFFDNELGGSLHGMSGAGLTDFGRAVVTEAEAREMIIDIAHSSEATAREVLAMTSRPVIVSHTGLKGHCDSARNYPDVLMTEIAEKGGLIGVGFWDGAVCEPTLETIAAAIVYAVDLLGPDNVALGSDFDGSIEAPLDASEIAALTSALLDAGLDTQTVRKVMGENAIRFFLENLPQ